MFNHKNSGQPEPEVSDLEKQVDAYMDPEVHTRTSANPKRAASKPAAIESKTDSPPLASAPVLPPLDIFEGQQPDDIISDTDTPAKKPVSDETPVVDNDATETTADTPADESDTAAMEEPILEGFAPDEPEPTPVATKAAGKSQTDAEQADTDVDTIADNDTDHDKPADAEPRTPGHVQPDNPLAPQKAPAVHRNPLQKIGHAVAVWWHNKPARYATLFILFVVLVAAGAVPTSRYYVLNTAGVRAATSITVMDRTTQLPLKNVAVSVGDVTGKTDKDGWIKLEQVRLGTQQLTIERLGFADVNRTVTLGLGSNPLGEEQLKAVGMQYTIELTDFLSGKPVRDAEAASGEATAVSDDDGKIILTLGQVETEKITVNLKATGYRDEKLTLDTAVKAPQKLALVTKQKNVYVSKQSGKYDVYQIDVDGKNKKLLLAGTGREDQQISLVQHPTRQLVALVSNRDNKQNQDGYRLSTLTIIRSNGGEPLSLDNSEDIRIIDWTDDKLVYVKIKAGTSAGNAERYQLMAYDPDTTINTQLATANHFSDMVSAKGSIYYAAVNNYQGGKSQFARVNPDNGNKQVLYSGDIWSIYRTRYDTLMLNNQEGWYSYTLGGSSVKKVDAAPSNHESRFYLDALNEKQSIWTENRDGKGILLSYDVESRKDTVIASQSGLTYPLKWLSDKVVVYRVVIPGETADYAVSIEGGEPRKIGDVTNTSGFGRWFYR